MNVVAKSTNLSPYLKTTTSVVSSGIRPAAGTGYVSRSRVVVKPTVTRMNGQSISENLLFRPLRVSSGITAPVQMVQKRLAHSDIEWPDFTPYRKSSGVDPTVNNRSSSDNRKIITYVLSGVSGVTAVYAAKSMVYTLVNTLSATADVLAMAKIEVNLNNIPEGKSAVFKWRGKPLFVRHRPANEITKEATVDITTLRDPQLDVDRVQRPQWLVVIGVCTHLGCVPIANAGDFGGYYCPCHGSHYDASGRIRKGPAPLNLEVPPYEIRDELLVVG